MRITQSLLMQNHARHISNAYVRLFKVQQQLVTGKRLQRPSDDPASLRPVLNVRSGLRRLEQLARNADLARSELSTSEGILRSGSELLARAQEIALAGANGSLNQGDRDGLAVEVEGLFDQLLSLANSRGLSGYLYGGSLKESAPFEEVETADGTVVLYRGDRQTTAVDLGEDLHLDLNVPGTEIFGIGARGAPIFTGSTGAVAGSGNSSLRGTDHLTIAHTRTVLGDGAVGGTGDSVSGLQVGASSAAGDTLLGPSSNWQVTLVDTSGTGAAGTLSVNGGPAVAWSSTDTDLQVLTATGEAVHLDFSSITAGFNGTVGAAGEGTLSLDGGQTTTAIDFTQQDQIVTDGETGGALFVDARAITRVGSELIRLPGAYDLFAALVELREALRNRDGLATDDQTTRIRATVEELKRGQDQILATLASLGARLRVIETTQARAAEVNLLLNENRSTLEDIDFAAASVELSQAELALQAGVMVSARLAQLPSLVTLL